MDKIEPNSHRYKDTLKPEAPPVEKRLQPVVQTGKARTQKKGAINKLSGNPISEDAQNVKSYIIRDVLIPSFQRIVSDIVTNGIDIILYGETGRTKKNNASRVSYINYQSSSSDRFGQNGTRYGSSGSRERGDTKVNRGSVSLFEDVVVDTRGEGEDILSRMSEYLEAFPVISIADLYDLAGISTFPHTYHNYGWRSVAEAKVVRVNEGYIIKMPPVESIK